ncbi:MAG: GNAT family N-acetyltransferase [Acidobacteria bacterium]|nr:GNAT family N-acetyltransferase [Acidobacteriota bacterium]
MLLAARRAELQTPTSGRWGEVLSHLAHDIYHTAQYHLLSGFGTVGVPQAFTYEEDGHSFLWPYFLAPIPQAPGYYDVMSAYGYPGPVGTPGAAFLERAWRALLDHWKQQRAVSAFTRFHPLLGNAPLLAGVTSEDGKPACAGVRIRGVTVSIDLTLPPERQFGGYQKKLRQAVRKLYREGYECSEDQQFTHLDDFVRVYRETMLRRKCRAEFLVDSGWVQGFRCVLGANARLFVTKYQGAVAAAMLVMQYASYLHCHLLGTADHFVAESPGKVLYDYVRQWGTERGLRVMHMGGGVGGSRDSLFTFKSRFAGVTNQFQIGQWVLNAPVYRELEAEHRARLAATGAETCGEFFPSYRAELGRPL